jgi:hypothetical protein
MQIGLLVGGILVTGFLLNTLYTATVTIPREKAETAYRMAAQARTAEIEDEAERERKYYLCLESAYGGYNTSWEGACETRGLGENCSLPGYQSETFNTALEDANERCVTMYK